MIRILTEDKCSQQYKTVTSSKEARQGRPYKLYDYDENTLVNTNYRFNCNMANPAPSEVQRAVRTPDPGRVGKLTEKHNCEPTQSENH